LRCYERLVKLIKNFITRFFVLLMNEQNQNIQELDILYAHANNNIRMGLAQNILFKKFETVVGALLVLLTHKKLSFENTQSGSFCSDVFLKLLDESSAYLGCLNQASFYSSFHHTRALVELFATARFCLNSSDTKIFEKYHTYNKIRRHILFLDSIHGSNSWNLSSTDQAYLKKNYGTIDQQSLALFGFKNIEQARLKISKSSNWFISIGELLKNAGEQHVATYERLCYYTHFSPLTDRSKQIVMGFPHWAEQAIYITAYYFLETINLLRDSPHTPHETQKLLREIPTHLGIINTEPKK